MMVIVVYLEMMEQPDVEQTLQEKLQSLRQSCVKHTSRITYLYPARHFILWLARNKPTFLNPDFGRYVDGFLDPDSILNELKNADIQRRPFDFEEVTADLIFEWMLSCKRDDGTFQSESTYNGKRSALKHLFRSYKVDHLWTVTLDCNCRTLLKGLKRQVADKKSRGRGKVKEGKDPLDFSLYQKLARLIIQEQGNDRGAIFAHTFLVFAWNLMCRAGNVVEMCLKHMEWEGDSMVMYFAHMKNDQEGKRKDPKHVFANPLLPEICPILALAIYLACHPIAQDQVFLFPGGHQYERYVKFMDRFLNQPHVVALLAEYGLKPSDLGAHSPRKGSATYTASGSTACPSSTAISLRIGWSMGKIHDIYLRCEYN